jgi:hypothetical protein
LHKNKNKNPIFISFSVVLSTAKQRKKEKLVAKQETRTRGEKSSTPGQELRLMI